MKYTSKNKRCTTTINFTMKPNYTKFIKSGKAKSSTHNIDTENALNAEKHKVVLSNASDDDEELESSTMIRLAKDPVKGFGIEVVDGSLTRERHPG
ncbi:hypothetical protein, partial [Salmonella sp. s51228]|uniref:hypothetical protein n=1 Tax=Salmonella sp. s51228 TaxID=3159652 RepID=UPI003980BE89